MVKTKQSLVLESLNSDPVIQDYVKAISTRVMTGILAENVAEPTSIENSSGSLTDQQMTQPDTQQEQVKPGDVLNGIYQMVLQNLLYAEMDSYLGRAKYEHTSSKAKEKESAEQKQVPAAVPVESSFKQDAVEVSSENPRFVSSTKNYRNGCYNRKVRSQTGDITVNMPRDRAGDFESRVLPKGLKDLTGMQDKILDLASAGNSCQDCVQIIKSMLGVTVSSEYVHLVVQSYQERLEQWRKRVLKPFYPFMFIDCLYVPVRGDDGAVNNRAVYVILGIDQSGHKELLHLHIGDGSEGKSEWLNILSEIQNRGVKDVLFLGLDGVSGLEDGVKSIFPNVKVQRCMVHIMRNSCEYVSTKDRKEFCADAKQLYQANNISDAVAALKAFTTKWEGRAKGAVKIWTKHFDQHIRPLYNYPMSIRKVIYTTNAIESVNSSLRKVVKKGCHSSKDSILAMMLLRADRVLSTNWERHTIRNWAAVNNALLINKDTAEIMAKYSSEHTC